MAKEIKIRISDNLSPLEEISEIAKRLKQKQLTSGGNNKDVLRIGREINVKQLTTTIVIERYSNEKPIEMVTCNVCGNLYQNNLSFPYYHNYGGKRAKRHTCSKECQENVLEFLGERAAKTKIKLKPLFKY